MLLYISVIVHIFIAMSRNLRGVGHISSQNICCMHQ